MDNLLEFCLLAQSKIQAQKKEGVFYVERVMGCDISVYIFDFVVISV